MGRVRDFTNSLPTYAEVATPLSLGRLNHSPEKPNPIPRLSASHITRSAGQGDS